MLFLTTFSSGLNIDKISYSGEEKSCEIHNCELNNGTLSGYVTDPLDNPIEGALIRVHFHGTYEEDHSDETGYYYVDNIPICYCMKLCICSKDGYQTESVELGITENTVYDFVLLTVGEVLLSEDFSGTFPPEGWEPGFFNQSNLSCCDSEPPCARGDWQDGYYDDFMMSKAIDASNYEKCIIKFYFGAQAYMPQYIAVYLKYRRNETSPWIDITPWDNMDDVCDYFEIEITYGPEGCGEALQIMWQFIGYYYFLDFLCVDDVKVLGIPINNPPEAPTITGPTSGKPNIEHEFSFNATDPDNDPVMYLVDWGDNNTGWTEYGDSGVEVILNHIWNEAGEYTIKAKAKDIRGAESEWGTLDVTIIPRNRAACYSVFFRFLDRFPLIQRILSILGVV